MTELEASARVALAIELFAAVDCLLLADFEGFACWNCNSWTLNILAVISTACWGSTAWGNVVLASLDGTIWALVLLTLLLDALDVTLFGAAASLASSDAPDVTIH